MAEDLLTSITTPSYESFAEVNFENLMKYPLGWIFALSWILVCIIIIISFECQCQLSNQNDIEIIQDLEII